MSEPLDIVIEGFLTPSQTLTYLHLPFIVPEGIARIDVAYTYTDAIGSDPHLQGGNTIDIGIFDPRGSHFLTDGFRGWSGSARTEFFIGVNDATPGYMPGAITAGEWSICLGLYKIADQGCHYTVTIRLSPGIAADAAFPMLLPLSQHTVKPAGWYKGELHCHTFHSDGDSDPVEVVRLAEAAGFDFLAITDHNVRSHLAALNRVETSLVLIPGYEVTTYNGHWNIWGGDGWIDFRILQPDEMRQAMRLAAANGYLVSCNHPRPYGPAWVFTEVEDYGCIEVWNGPRQFFNDEALAFWEARLREGKRFTAVGGSDAHFHHRDHPARLGQPTTWVYCADGLSAAGVLQALRAGHSFITDSPEGPQLYLTAADAIMGDTVTRPDDNVLMVQVRVIDGVGLLLELYGEQGRLADYAMQTEDEMVELRLSVAETCYVRAQLATRETPPTVRALTNPIYLL